ncbi:MAG: ribulose-phosphate 3-epimerase [Calditrichia bacterium]
MTVLSRKYKILPSILSADFGRLVEEANTVDIPEIDTLHIDVMDGHYVPNLTFGPGVVESLKTHTRFKMDVHLMIDNAPEFIPQFAAAGADHITIHAEAVKHLHRNIYQIKNLGITAGVSLNPATPLETIQWVLRDVDLALLMSVNPGFGGQEFIQSSVPKIKQLVNLRASLGAHHVIEVDGGIDHTTAGEVFLAGADFLVVGNAIFNEKDRAGAIRKIMKSIDTLRTDRV